MPDVYFILGLPGSGRREVVLDLIEGGLPETHRVTIYHAASEPPESGGPAARPGIDFVPYVFAGGHFTGAADAEPGKEPDAVFFLADGRASPIDQLEAFPAWLQERGWELARILLVVNCTLAAQHPAVEQWHEACGHFADCVLLNRGSPAAHTWAQQFQKKFSAGRYPCVFVTVKQDHVDNAHVVLFPEARRRSLAFDNIDPLDDLDLDEEELPEELSALENKPDPYFERMPNGQRRKPVPDVTAWLPR